MSVFNQTKNWEVFGKNIENGMYDTWTIYKNKTKYVFVCFCTYFVTGCDEKKKNEKKFEKKINMFKAYNVYCRCILNLMRYHLAL